MQFTWKKCGLYTGCRHICYLTLKFIRSTRTPFPTAIVISFFRLLWIQHILLLLSELYSVVFQQLRPLWENPWPLKPVHTSCTLSTEGTSQGRHRLGNWNFYEFSLQKTRDDTSMALHTMKTQSALYNVLRDVGIPLKLVMPPVLTLRFSSEFIAHLLPTPGTNSAQTPEYEVAWILLSCATLLSKLIDSPKTSTCSILHLQTHSSQALWQLRCMSCYLSLWKAEVTQVSWKAMP